jgi:YHS domain-containing protein
VSPIDPVCCLEVDKKSAAASYALDGTTYLVCSERCLEAFKKNPRQYSARAHQTSAPLADDVSPQVRGKLRIRAKIPAKCNSEKRGCQFRIDQMRNRAGFRALPALAIVFIIAAPLYAEACALAHGGYGVSTWKRCPKARQCPPAALVELDKISRWNISTADGPTNRNARTRKTVLIAF